MTNRLARILMTLTALPLAAAGTVVASPAPATAAVTFPRIDASGFRLVAGDTFATYGSRITALERDPRLAPAGLAAVLDGANRQGRPLCHPTNLAASLSPAGFCWDTGEDDTANVWIPQGVTGSGDAQSAGTVLNGRRVIAATWHYTDDSFIRVSFLDLATLRYRHVLLVEPTATGTFQAISGHGHGLYWYGNKLVVATGGAVLRVFDLAHIWRTDTSSAEVGLGADGNFHARYHAFALPQVGAFWYEGGGCANTTGNRPCFASLALDRTDGSFVAVEHTTRGGGRIVRWPIDPATGLPRRDADGYVRAVEAFGSPVWGMQGAVSHGGQFVIAGVCPEYADNIGDGVDYPSCLHRGVGGQSTTVWTKAPKNTENLSYWPATGELWLINEQLRERVTVHVPWPS
ncbi:hypothetical protein ONA91_35840 [Micromonospora sp. DR5-3]|uniref:hypothetical protein n=1 Tax=unclassified Micromonospora TaxID=2617518 RepID=UPI001CA317CA|nr:MULTISPECIES: hypothetical protein [unclassified Micromonospora]MCW3819822.1 hypothetical protein [Micromonospora sp. DR5-3]